MKTFKYKKQNERDNYKCNKCECTTIYRSRTPRDPEGTLTCFKCGETEDARYGINKNGVLITTFRAARMHQELFAI